MSLSTDDIIELASRYVPQDEMIQFVFNGDLFAILIKDISQPGKFKDDEGWAFAGYGHCLGYEIDEDVKPRGKWLWMRFVSLQEFPPAEQALRLQPPHVVKGSFQTPDRTQEIKLLKINLIPSARPQIYVNEMDEETAAPPPSSQSGSGDNIIQFKKKKSGGKK